MIIPCKSCHAVFRLSRSAIRPAGSRVKCSKCGEIFRIYPPNVEERRKHQRVKTQNLISYFAFDDAGKLISHGLGIALDISKGGILLESTDPIKPGLIILTAIDRENNIFEVKGELAYSKKISAGRIFSGIKFTGVNERVTTFITNLIKENYYRADNLHIRWRDAEAASTPHKST